MNFRRHYRTIAPCRQLLGLKIIIQRLQFAWPHFALMPSAKVGCRARDMLALKSPMTTVLREGKALMGAVIVTIMTSYAGCASAVNPGKLPLSNEAREILHRIDVHAAQKNTSAIVVSIDGNIVSESYLDGPDRAIDVMSITKSVVSLVIGTLAEGNNKNISIDDSLSKIFAEFKSNDKDKVSLRHILDHSSCLSWNSVKEVYAQENFIDFALKSELICDPGQEFFYNNKISNLLTGVIEGVTNQSLRDYAQYSLFSPLGIACEAWLTDPQGHHQSMAGLHLHARDLVKIGELVRLGGWYDNKAVVPKKWIEALATPSSINEDHSLMWWLGFPLPMKAELESVARQIIWAQGAGGQLLLISPCHGLTFVHLYEVHDGEDNELLTERFLQLMRMTIELAHALPPLSDPKIESVKM